MTRKNVGTSILALTLAAATPSGAAQACSPVPGTDLEKCYPVMPGWTRGAPQSETDPAESGHGEIHVLVADRFMVRVTAESSNLQTLQYATKLVPMSGLAALR